MKKTAAAPKDTRTLARQIAQIASDHKANDIAVLDLRRLTSFTDFFVICSGSSDRHVVAIADAIHEEQKELGRLPLGEEGLRTGRWALLDYGDVVVHIFYQLDREHYQLEKLWYDAPRLAFKGIND
jgi:ribosome-associated protein